MKIEDAIRGVSRLAFDTAPIIYFVEANPTYDALVSNIFNRVASGVIEGRTSVISLREVLVQPILARRRPPKRLPRAASKEFQLPNSSNRCDGCGKCRALAGSLRPSPT